jgi:hypothetical protein
LTLPSLSALFARAMFSCLLQDGSGYIYPPDGAITIIFHHSSSYLILLLSPSFS